MQSRDNSLVAASRCESGLQEEHAGAKIGFVTNDTEHVEEVYRVKEQQGREKTVNDVSPIVVVTYSSRALANRTSDLSEGLCVEHGTKVFTV
jgi:hypothetical protein